ncbi:hypothetical protein [Halorubrum trueperi]|uniref:Uncharacterized protein n=1 Tax=Halorubrum trueperi TaxID=2004704 RepID=A0ABD5UI92_9EURY
MSASTPSVGIDHPTVVPANFDPEERTDDAFDPEERTDDADDSGASEE